ncbi:Uncharacterised protein [Yersinia massiliensis]|uniref:hypothetical protein n=1 Tax=Yersinia massiliensis TaxID=419257 RepID=UPI0005DEFD0B|nr:hypothetical protein [Yersinia massiliensis]CNH24848.1 Uncharacterised protein [Yersinia massiliensis]
MNYQSANMLVSSAKIASIATLCMLVAFFGLTAAIFYLLILGLVFSVWVSIALHHQTEKGFVNLNTDKTQWITYIQGVPVRETRSWLKNPCFINVARLSSFFTRFLIIKMLIQLALIYLALQQTPHLTTTFSPYLTTTLSPYLLLALRIIGVVMACILIQRLWLTVKTLLALRRSEWVFEEVPKEGFSYYQAYIIKHDKKSGEQRLQPALAELLAL